MTPKIFRILGIVFCISAAILAVLNLNRGLGLGLTSLPVLLFAAGVLCFVRAKFTRS